MSSPKSLAIDSSDNIWVSDSEYHRIKKYNSSGVWQADYGVFGSGNGQFNSPRGIAIDGSNNIYVCDTFNNRIQKFNSSMTYQTQWGSSGTGNGQFDRPVDLAIDSSNNIYVADSYNNRIQKFTDTGTYVTKWGTYGSANGQFFEPSGVAVSGSNVFVLDTYNYRIQKFSNTGSYVSKTGTYGTANGQFGDALGITTDPAGNLHVADTYNSRIQKFNTSLTWLSTLVPGTGESYWTYPWDVAFDSSGSLFLVDYYYDEIHKYVFAYPPLKNAVANEISPTIRTYPALGYDGTDLLVGAVDNDAMDLDEGTGAGVAKYSKTTIAFTGTHYRVADNIVANTSTTYIGINNFDYGASRVVIGTGSTMRVYTYSGTTLTADTTYPTWTFDGTAKVAGWDGTNFYHAADTTVLRRYSGFKANPAVTNQRRFWSQYQWENGATQGTLPSPKAPYLDLLDRRWLNITVPSPGAGTGYTRIFTGNGTSTTNSQMWALTGVLSTAGTVQTETVLTSGTNPKTVADLPTGAAGVFEAEEGSFTVNGNSIGTWHEKAATPRWYGKLTADQSVATGTTAVTLLWTQDSTFSNAMTNYLSYNAGTGRVTILKAGWWRVTGQILWDATAGGGSRRFWIDDSTGASFRICYSWLTGSTVNTNISNVITTSRWLDVNTILEAKCVQTSGASLNVNGAAAGSCQLQVVYEGPAAV